MKLFEIPTEKFGYTDCGTEDALGNYRQNLFAYYVFLTDESYIWSSAYYHAHGLHALDKFNPWVIFYSDFRRERSLNKFYVLKSS